MRFVMGVPVIVMPVMVVAIVHMMVAFMPGSGLGRMGNIWSVYYNMLIRRTHFKL